MFLSFSTKDMNPNKTYSYPLPVSNSLKVSVSHNVMPFRVTQHVYMSTKAHAGRCLVLKGFVMLITVIIGDDDDDDDGHRCDYYDDDEDDDDDDGDDDTTCTDDNGVFIRLTVDKYVGTYISVWVAGQMSQNDERIDVYVAFNGLGHITMR